MKKDERMDAGREDKTPAKEAAVGDKPNHEVRMPFKGIPEEGIGVGDLVKRVTDVFRIKPCNGCEKRRKVLNRWVIKGSGGAPAAGGEGRS